MVNQEAKKEYRNSLRSRKLIKVALLQLMLENDISRIKVKEVIEIADISKGTFYAHYTDVFNVLEEIENENIQLLRDYLQAQPRVELINDFSPFIVKVFNNIEANLDFYKILFATKNANSFLNKMQKVFVDYMMEDHLMLTKLRNKEEAMLFFSFISIGTANLLQDWFNCKCEISLEGLAKLLNECIVNGVGAIKK